MEMQRIWALPIDQMDTTHYWPYPLRKSPFMYLQLTTAGLVYRLAVLLKKVS